MARQYTKLKDLTEQRFDRLIVIAEATRHPKYRTRRWLCVCDCGNNCIVDQNSLTQRGTRSCGCLSRNPAPRPLMDLTGKRYGWLVVIKEVDRRIREARRWVCQCDCGAVTEVAQTHLRQGSIRSCGCYLAFITGERRRIHGARNTPEYGVWMGMRRRCNNPNDNEFKNYGGRGIKVCERWNDFRLFFSDMGVRPSNAHSIDRIDNNGDYRPENCRWATVMEQASNRRNLILITYNGKTQNLMRWASEKGLNYGCLLSRIRRGCSVDDLFAQSKRNPTARP